MKRYLIIAIISFMVVMAKAQEVTEVDSLQNVIDRMQSDTEQQTQNSKIWGNGKYLRLGYAISQTCDEIGPVEKGKFSLFVNTGRTIKLHKNPVAKMIRFGLDVGTDIQFSKYKDSDILEWTVADEVSTDNDDEDGFMSKFNIGKMAMMIGVNFGPNVSIAPFAMSGIKNLKYLRATVYFHYVPTFGMYMLKENDETEISMAFCNMFDFGGNISYRKIAIGIEGKWGSGKFKPMDFSSMLGEEELGLQKYTRKFANTRIYLQINF